MTQKCSYPPCPASRNETRAELERLGWTFKRGEVLCPTHATIEALFPIAQVKEKTNR